MTATGDLHGVGLTGACRLGTADRTFLRTRRFPHRVGECFEVVTARLDRAGIGGQPDDLPAARRGQALGMLGTQVVTVGFRVGGERAEHSGRIRIDVRQRCDGGTAARSARTATYRAHDVGRYRTLERAATTLHDLTRPCRPGSPDLSDLRTLGLTCVENPLPPEWGR